MDDTLLTAKEAATRLGVSAMTLYGWLGLSDRGLFMIQGRHTTINYFQGGAFGQGRIRIEAAEVERIRELMRVHPKNLPPRRNPARHDQFPGITVPLGRPDRQS